MNLNDLKSKPLWQLTGEEFLYLHDHAAHGRSVAPPNNPDPPQKRYVYGLRGLATLFGCSVPTANRIKRSGRIDRAITQIGRKIVVDAELALELAGRKSGGR